MGRKRKTQIYQIPEEILNNLNEHIGNGWFLFAYPTEETGFQIHSNFGSEFEFKSLKNDILKYLNAIEVLEQQNMLMALTSGK